MVKILIQFFFNCETHLNYLDEENNKRTCWEDQEFDPKVIDNDHHFGVVLD